MKRKSRRVIELLIFILLAANWAGANTRAASGSTGNLITDSGFETGLAGFAGSYGETLVRSTEAPLGGTASVVVNSNNWGSDVIWQKELNSAFASTYSNKGNSFTVSAKIKPDFVASGVTFQICASVYYFTGNAENCQSVTLAPGTTINPTVSLTLDPTRSVATLFFHIKHTNGSPIQYNLDDVNADFNYVTAEATTGFTGSGTTSGTTGTTSGTTGTTSGTTGTTSGTTNTTSGTTGTTSGTTGTTSGTTGTTSGTTGTTSDTTGTTSGTTTGSTNVTSPEVTAGSASTPNLLADPNFESGVSGFYPQSVRDSVVQTQTNPIQGEGSLAVISNQWGSTAIWQQQITSAFASQYSSRGVSFTFNGKIKITKIGADVRLNACVGVSYFTGTDERCVAVPTTKNTVSNVTVSLPLNASNGIGHLFVRLKHTSGSPIQYLVDQASAVFTYTPGATSGSTEGTTTGGTTTGGTTTGGTTTGGTTTGGTTTGGTTTGGTTTGSTGTGPTTITLSGLGFTPRPTPITCSAGTNRTFNVGTSQTYTSLGAVPWGTLTAGDTVRIHYRATPYREKILISGFGTATNPITVCGVADPTTGALPVIDGNNATTATNIPWYYDGTQTRGVVIIAMRDGNVYGTKPTHVTVKGLEIRGGYYQYQYTNSAGARQYYPGVAAAVFVERGENITITGNTITDSGNGLFVASGGDEASLSRNIIIDGNYIYGNGTPTDPARGLDNFHRHNLYTEADRVTMQNNFFGPQREGAAGNNIKDRSAGTVIRNNFIMGGAHLLDLVDPEDAYQLIATLPYYRQTYVYENIFINRNTDAGNMVHYGGDLGVPGNTRQGTLYFYNNTVVIQQNQDRHWETSLLQLETAAETADLRNNVIYKEGTATLNILNDNVGRANFGRNWITPGYVAGGNISGLENLIVGSNPGFTNLATYNLRPTASSPLVDVGGPLHPNVPTQHQTLYEYRNGAAPALRPLNGSTWDFGALEAN